MRYSQGVDAPAVSAGGRSRGCSTVGLRGVRGILITSVIVNKNGIFAMYLELINIKFILHVSKNTNSMNSMYSFAVCILHDSRVFAGPSKSNTLVVRKVSS